jgi:hypothetical protein
VGIRRHLSANAGATGTAPVSPAADSPIRRLTSKGKGKTSWSKLRTVLQQSVGHTERAEFGHIAMFVQELRVLTHSVETPESQLRDYKANKMFKRGTAVAGNPKHQVFLGGSCNPTTWRKEQAIPVLKNAGVVYFNPQVEHWSPDLCQIEEKAKASCDILFFVLDNMTRGIASMVEVAYLAGCGREMVTVMVDYERRPQIGGKDLSVVEADALNRGRDFLCSILRFEQIPVFNEVPVALSHLTRMARSDKVMDELAKSKFVTVPIFRGIRLSDDILGASGVFRNATSGKCDERLTVGGATLALREYFQGADHIGEIVEDDVEASLQASHRGTVAAVTFDQDAFLCTIADFKMRAYFKGLEVAATVKKAQKAWVQVKTGEGLPSNADGTDIFLGGCCFKNGKGHNANADWREVFAIPNLEKLKVSYYNPDVLDWSPTLIAAERECKRKSKVLLMVIGSNTRGIGSLVEAAHLIGEGHKNMVLVLQNVDVNSSIEGEQVDEQEAKDLNRGRAYLEDAASINNIRVCSSIQEALAIALQTIGVKAESGMFALPTVATPAAGVERQPSLRWAKRATAQSKLRLRSRNSVGDGKSRLNRRSVTASAVALHQPASLPMRGPRSMEASPNAALNEGRHRHKGGEK